MTLKKWEFEYQKQPLIGSSSNYKHKLTGPNRSKKRFQWRRPSIEDDIKIWKYEYLSSHWSDLSQILSISSWDQTKVKKGFDEDDLQWKTISNGRWPQNMKSWIYQQPLIGSSLNFRHKLMGPNQIQKNFNKDDRQ